MRKLIFILVFTTIFSISTVQAKENTISYNNSRLKIGFDYPEAWGAFSIETKYYDYPVVVQSLLPSLPTVNCYPTGFSWQGKFSNKPGIIIGGKSRFHNSCYDRGANIFDINNFIIEKDKLILHGYQSSGSIPEHYFKDLSIFEEKNTSSNMQTAIIVKETDIINFYSEEVNDVLGLIKLRYLSPIKTIVIKSNSKEDLENLIDSFRENTNGVKKPKKTQQ
jgi:hypothetical protein